MLELLPGAIPLAPSIGLNGRALAFAGLATLGTATLVAVLPTLRVSRGSTVPQSGARDTQTKRQRRVGGLLLGLEAGQAAALLVVAGLMINTLIRMASAGPGFDPEGLLYVHLDLPARSFAPGGDATRRAQFMDDLASRVRAVPGVRAVGTGSATPFSGMTFVTAAELEGGVRPGAGTGGLEVFGAGSDNAYFSRVHVDPDYLATLGLPVVAGRGIEGRDVDAAETVGLINQTAAEAYWPDENPIGRRIRERDGQWVTVAGVLADFGHPGLPMHEVAELYLPMSREVLPGVSRPTLLVRHIGDDETVMEGIRRAVWSIDPELPIPAIGTATSALGASLAMPRFYALLLGSFAGLALLLAAVGTYGVVAHSVARRTREMGIRIALGAQPREVGVMVARDGLTAVTLGLAAGIAAGVTASRLIRGLLWGVEPLDPVTCAAVAATLVTVAGLAIAVPSRRAMRADPVASLRAD
jgi:predicted permease